MGGSGGRFYSDTISASNLSAKEVAADAELRRREFEQAVGEYFAELLKDANARDVEATQTHLKEIRDALNANLDETVELRFGGSVSKSTHVEGLSDIDCLAILKGVEFANLPPSELRTRFAEILQQRFPRTKVEVGDLAVTLHFADMEIQVLPAIRAGQGVKIASPRGTGWVNIFPRAFKDSLTKVNNQQGGQVVPLIKVAKELFSNQPEQRRPEGYHLECLAVNIFRNFTGEKLQRGMLMHFLESSASMVRSPIPDISGQSIAVDEYLGAANSLARRNLSDSFSTLARRLKSADVNNDFTRWKKIFEE